MIITSIDIETTGLNPNNSQVLQIGAVVFDTNSDEFKPIATYNKIVLQKEIHGDPFAVQMNASIIKRICEYNDKVRKYKNFVREYTLVNNTDDYEKIKDEADKLLSDIVSNSVEYENVSKDFAAFLTANNAYYVDNNKMHFNATGKNFWGFDNRFLELLPNWNEFIHFHRRSFDPGSLYFYPSDNVLPSLEECKKRAIEQGCTLFENSNVSHDALDDAMDVAKLVWRYIKLNFM